MIDQRTHDDLFERIEEVFASRERPHPDQIAWRLEESAHYEGNRVFEYFAERSPHEVDFESMVAAFGSNVGECLAFLRAEGLCFFLPAFLRIALDVEGTGDFSDRLVFAISKPGQDSIEELNDRFDSIVAELDDAQKTIVRDVLEAISEESSRLGDPDCDAHSALETYWRDAAMRGDDRA
jgi:hypothetical protein